MVGALQTLVASLMCWFVASSLWIYPHSLSYFNESIGGPLNGAEHLLGSNVDWGQDLRRMESCFASVSPNYSVRVLYSGGFGPASSLIRHMNLDFEWNDIGPSESIAWAVSLNVIYGDGRTPFVGPKSRRSVDNLQILNEIKWALSNRDLDANDRAIQRVGGSMVLYLPVSQ